MDKKILKEKQRLEKLILNNFKVTWKDRFANFWDNVRTKPGRAITAGISATILSLAGYCFYTRFTEEHTRYEKLKELTPNLRLYLSEATAKRNDDESINKEAFLFAFSPLEKKALELCSAFPSEENKVLCDKVHEVSINFFDRNPGFAYIAVEKVEERVNNNDNSNDALKLLYGFIGILSLLVNVVSLGLFKDDYSSDEIKSRREDFKRYKRLFDETIPDVLMHPCSGFLITYTEALAAYTALTVRPILSSSNARPSPDNMNNLFLCLKEASALKDEKYLPFLQLLREKRIAKPSELSHAKIEFEMRLKIQEGRIDHSTSWENSAFRYLVELKEQLDKKEFTEGGEQYHLITPEENKMLKVIKAGELLEIETAKGFKVYTPMAAKQAKPSPLGKRRKNIIDSD